MFDKKIRLLFVGIIYIGNSPFILSKPEQDVIGLSTHLTRQTATMSEGVAEETSCLPGDPLHGPSCKYTNQPTSMAIRNLEQQVSI